LRLDSWGLFWLCRRNRGGLWGSVCDLLRRLLSFGLSLLGGQSLLSCGLSFCGGLLCLLLSGLASECRFRGDCGVRGFSCRFPKGATGGKGRILSCLHRPALNWLGLSWCSLGGNLLGGLWFARAR
jgi:hypothetical protein